MKRTHLILFAGILCCSPAWAGDVLGGYFYQQQEAPTGWEWQSPDSVAVNKLQPHAWFFSFRNIDEARKVLPENSSYWKSLDGMWKFHWAPNPDERPKDFFRTDYDVSKWDDIKVPMNWNMAGLQRDGKNKYGDPLYSNQRVIFQHSWQPMNDWKGGVMRTPPKDWMTYRNRNEVGSYRRTFSVPADWKGQEIYLNFDGVDSFFYLYINGKYVGFSKNSRNLAEFNITPYLNKEGEENTVAVEVYRHSDGSFLESQDMFRLPGIFRTVALTAKPQVQVRDFKAIPDLDETYSNAKLHITAQLQNLSKKAIKGYTIQYSLYANRLYSDENTLLSGVTASAKLAGKLNAKGEIELEATLDAANKVNLWSAEAPHRYTLVGELKDGKGRTVQTFSTFVGFRKVEIKETPAEKDEFGLAGRYYYLNGQPIKLKGVNRHENNVKAGHTVSREQMEHEVFLMKRGNINHVRNCHYPDAPYWYYLCDKYGIYLEDEANVESHEYYYGKQSLSHVPEFRNAHIARNMEMVHATVNHPSVVIWSLGNEAGPGKTFVDCYNAIKAYDTSRPVQYERNNDIVDMGSNQYPSIAWVQGAVQGKYKLKYPFHISEYAHSMGNACGNLIDYWDAIESTNFFMGGAIWDWVDQALDKQDPATGKTYWAYGGDFGKDNKPNDGMFCMNGIMRPDLTPKAQYFEVKKVYQNVGVKAIDMKQGLIEIFNKNYFEPLKNYQIVWSLYKDGVCVKKNQPLQGAKNIVGPREKGIYTLPYDYASLDANSEYFVTVQFLLGKDMPWAKKGYPQMEEQLRVKGADVAAPSIAAVAKTGKAMKYQLDKAAKRANITGENFQVAFDLNTGAIYSLKYGNQEIIKDGNGPQLDAYRAPTDNDAGIGYHNAWFKNGLYDLQHVVKSWTCTPNKKDGTYKLDFTVESQGKEGCDVNYGNRDRDPESCYNFEKNKRALTDADLKFTSRQIYTIYKDGSIEMQSAIGANRSKVILPRIGYSMVLPSELNLYDYYGRGPVNNYNDRKTSQFIGWYHSPVAEQGIMLPKPQAQGNREEVRWCAVTNSQQQGVVFISDSTMSASALPWSQQELTLAAHPYQLPKSSGTHLHLDAKVTGLGGASCGQGGPLTPDQVRSTPTTFGFIIRPAVKSELPNLVKVSATGRKMVKDIMQQMKQNQQNTGLQIAFASSQEPDEGDASYLVDGDPSTIWHTMYSITLAKYPHWVDFDAGKQKVIKGFTYLARQDGSLNGCIKDYEIYVSNDNKNWGEPVVKGSFEKTAKLQKVMFGKPVKARYVRLRALNEQSGQDYASGAEFTLVTE
ncbi:discoidin domain-containing protein [Prevotella copri]|uniref:glycoside hydrolase family 2 TIM barrel-domain containing protein n=1 Tax=Segatella copri TaxID=165179 RepID=UPI00222F843F|nr:glycoside hydrolase family 2 TIM barrel-domain containing protein [Segatella copri]MCW4117692.1 discoidin domain-containing protein [Segatella copri]